MSAVKYEITNTSIIKDSNGNDSRYVEKTEKKVIIPQEDSYIKVYLKDIGKLHDLAPQHNAFLYEIFKHASWNTQEILLPTGLKKKLAEEMKTSVGNLDIIISKLAKKEIIIKKGTGFYILNPYLFGKGDWKNIRELRIQIDYDIDTGKKTVRTIRTKKEIEEDIKAQIEEEIDELEQEEELSSFQAFKREHGIL